jgi:hypothetical protein
MWPHESSFTSQFEREGEEQVRRKLADHSYHSAQAYGEATSWLEQKDRERAQRDREVRQQAQEARLLAERQARAAEASHQLGERQVKLTENANRLAEEANRFSKWAIGIGIASFIVAIAVAVLK